MAEAVLAMEGSRGGRLARVGRYMRTTLNQCQVQFFQLLRGYGPGSGNMTDGPRTGTTRTVLPRQAAPALAATNCSDR